MIREAAQQEVSFGWGQCQYTWPPDSSRKNAIVKDKIEHIHGYIYQQFEKVFLNVTFGYELSERNSLRTSV